jgi:hypothetical protein
MNLSQLVPYLLLVLVLASVATTVIYLGVNAGNVDVRNELQKHVAILSVTNLLTVIFLGFLLYYYILSNPASFLPFSIFMLSFNMFLGIMSVSIAVLQQIA